MSLTDCVTSSCSLFADDCLLYRPIQSTGYHRILQKDLSQIEDWADKWMVTFTILINVNYMQYYR